MRSTSRSRSTRNVGAIDVPAVGGRRRPSRPSAAQDALDLGVGHRRAEQAREALAAQVQRAAARAAADSGRRSARDARRRRSARSSAIARCSATTGALMSAPRSKRADASVFRPSRLLVRRTDAGLKYALSNTTRRRRRRDLRVGAAHHAGDRLRAVARRRSPACPASSVALDAVERRDASRPASRARDAQLARRRASRGRTRASAGRARASRSW